MKDKKELNGQKGIAASKPKKKKKKILMIVLAIIVVLAAVIGTAVHNATKQVSMVSNLVEVEPVQKRDLSDTISLKGSIAGASSTNVTSKAVSEITSLNVQVGDIVKEGDVLCTLDSASIEEKIADLEKNISNAQAVDNINSQQTKTTVDQAIADQATALEAAQKAITQAEESCNAAQIAYDKDPGDETFPALLNAQRAVEDAKDSYDKTLEDTNRAIENARIQMQLDQYKGSDSTSKDTLADLKEQLEDCEIKAPCGGVVTAVNVRVGDINAEKATILTIEDTSSLKLVATVAEADILKLQEGMKASVTADATGEETITGTVSRVVRVKSSGGTDGAGGGYSVEIAIDNRDLLVGMEAKAKVMIKEKGEVLAVPYDLIQYDENGNAFVLVAEGNADGSATAVKKNIEVGEEVDYYTEITGGDLKEGDKLIYDYTFSTVEGATFAPEQMYSEQSLGATDGSTVTVDGDGAAEVVE